MLAEGRRPKTGNLPLHESSATIADLASVSGTSEMTICRDPDALVGLGVCQRIYGDTMSLRMGDRRSVAYASFLSREQAQAWEKAAIAAPAAATVQPDDAIVVDSGTTAVYLAHALRSHDARAVISNSLNVLGQLNEVHGIIRILQGSVLAVEDMSAGGGWIFAGPVAVAGLRSFRSMRVLGSTSAITLAEGAATGGF